MIWTNDICFDQVTLGVNNIYIHIESSVLVIIDILFDQNVL